MKEHLRKYQKLVLLFPKDIKHPRSSCQYFNCFCQDYHIDSAIVENTDQIQIRKGEVYIAIRQIEVVNIIKQSRTTGLKCGEDFGLIAYNDTPAYEVIDQGITVLSINWEEPGEESRRICANRTGNKNLSSYRSPFKKFNLITKTYVYHEKVS